MSNPTNNPATCVLPHCRDSADGYVLLPGEAVDPEDLPAVCGRHRADAERSGYTWHRVR